MSLGLGTSLSKSGLITPGIVTDSLVLKHNYAAGGVVPVSDGAVLLNGTDEYIDLGSKATSGDDVTVSAWIYLVDANPNDILKYGDLMVRMHNDTSLYVYPDSAETGGFCTVSSALNNWNHICVVVDDNAATFYYNGVFIKTHTSIGTLSTDSVASYIGRQDTNYFNGYICNIGFWSRTMEIAEVKSIMWKNYAGLTTGTGSESENLVSWWNLSANANDDHGSNNGTLT